MFVCGSRDWSTTLPVGFRNWSLVPDFSIDRNTDPSHLAWCGQGQEFLTQVPSVQRLQLCTGSSCRMSWAFWGSTTLAARSPAWPWGDAPATDPNCSCRGSGGHVLIGPLSHNTPFVTSRLWRDPADAILCRKNLKTILEWCDWAMAYRPSSKPCETCTELGMSRCILWELEFWLSTHGHTLQFDHFADGVEHLECDAGARKEPTKLVCHLVFASRLWCKFSCSSSRFHHWFGIRHEFERRHGSFRACAVFDKYLSLQDKAVSADQIKVVAATCLKVSDVFGEQSKEYYKQENSVEYAEAAAGKSITPLQMLSCEKEILPKLGFKLFTIHPTIRWFLQCYVAYARLSMRDCRGEKRLHSLQIWCCWISSCSCTHHPWKHSALLLMAAFLVQQEATSRHPKDKAMLNEDGKVLGPLQGHLSCLDYWDQHIRGSVCRANLAVDTSMCLQAVVRMLSDKRREWKSLQLNAVETKHVQLARAFGIPRSIPCLQAGALHLARPPKKFSPRVGLSASALWWP